MPYPKPRVRRTGESLSQVKIRLVQEQRQRTLARQRQLLAEVVVDEDVQACNRATAEDEFEERTATESTEDKRLRTPTFLSSRVICCDVCIVVCLSLVISVTVSIALFSFLERRQQQLRDGL
jgi:hypothetical protein